MNKSIKLYWLIILVAVVIVLSPILAMFNHDMAYEAGFDDGWQSGYSGGFNQAITAKQGVIFTSCGSSIGLAEINVYPQYEARNITIKYFDDGSGNPGLVAKWWGGYVVTDNGCMEVAMIQRLEAWINDRTGGDYNINWETSP